MQLFKVLLFVCLIYGTSARDFFDFLDPYLRQFIQQNRDLMNRECQNVLARQGDNLKTGWPELGIKPLDPVNIPRFELPLGIADITLIDAELRGTSDFTVKSCDIQVFGLNTTLYLHFKQLSIVGKHETRAQLGSGSGDAEILLTDVDVVVGFEFGVKGTNQLNLDKIIFDIDVADVLAKFTGFAYPWLDSIISAAIAEPFKLLVNAGDILFEPLFNPIIVSVNVFLNQITLPQLIADIIAFIIRFGSY